MTGITLDVTHRKQAEQERRAPETFKGEFIATLAHEMRNALAPIVNTARLFESDVSEENKRKAQQIVGRQAKFTPPGGHLHVRVFSDQGGNAVLEVEDDGIGIDDSQQSRIFDMFAQVAPSSGTGFGIGLALIQRIVKMHGGRVSVRSDGLGKGTVFTITLPSSASTDRSPAREFGHPL
jgi:signal transduction histidine kinase